MGQGNETPRAAMLVVRHTKTDYLEAEGKLRAGEMDITKEGIELTRGTARQFADYLKGFDQIIVVTSPQARAQGTAKVFLEELGMTNNPHIMKAIRCVDIYDLEKFNEFNDLNSTPVYGELWFNHPELEKKNKVMEGRANVNKRAYRFLYHLGKFLKRKVNDNNKVCVVAFTHFEIASNYLRPLYNQSEIFPGEEAPGIQNAEAVILSFEDGNPDNIIVRARGREARVELKDNKLILTEEI